MGIYRFVAINMLLLSGATAHNSEKKSLKLVWYMPQLVTPGVFNYISLAFNTTNSPVPFASEVPLYRRSGVKLTKNNNATTITITECAVGIMDVTCIPTVLGSRSIYLCQDYIRLGKSASKMNPQYLDSITLTEIKALTDRPSVLTITGGSGRYKRATGSGFTVEEVSGYAQLPIIAASKPTASQTPCILMTYNFDFDDHIMSLPAPVGKYPNCMFN